MTEPLLTIAIPTLNGSKTIGQISVKKCCAITASQLTHNRFPHQPLLFAALDQAFPKKNWYP